MVIFSGSLFGVGLAIMLLAAIMLDKPDNEFDRGYKTFWTLILILGVLLLGSPVFLTNDKGGLDVRPLLIYKFHYNTVVLY